MPRTIAKAFSAAVIVVAALRLTCLCRVVPLDGLPLRLRRGRRLPAPLQDPVRLAAGVDRIGRFLPPWGMGWCLKRSLLLLEVWSRCGLRPTLHLAVRHGESRRIECHAWVSGTGWAEPPGAESDFVEAWAG